MSTQLQLLRNLGAAHQTMARLAEALDWEGVASEWQGAEAQFRALQNTPPLAGLSATEQAEARQLIEEVLRLQASISARAKPWMEQVAPLLECFARHPLPSEPA